tara:strand:+ start:549 stop:2099 length:1551 start_codon:yes stop_codon:yes gene_type:complete
MADELITPGLQTSPMFRVKGQMSRWRYPDQRLTPENPTLLTNVNLTERGQAATRFGYRPYNSVVLPSSAPAVGFKQITFPGNSVREVVPTSSKIYADDGTTRTVLTGDALTAGNDDYARIIYLQKKAILNNGVDQIQLWDGNLANNFADMTGMPWTKAQDIVAHKGVLVVLRPTITVDGAAVEFPTRFYWSDIERKTYQVDIETWLETNRTELYEGGAPIIGAVDNWGLLWIAKEDGMYTGKVVNQTGRLEYEFGEEFKGFSPVAKHALLARPEFVFGVAKEGPFVFRRDGSFSIITEDIQDEWNSLNQSRLQFAQARIREKDRQVRLRVSSAANSNGHDKELVWDWITNDVWFDETTDAMNYCEQVTVSNIELDLLAGFDGFLYKGNESSQLTDNGASFEWRIKMQPNDLGHPGKTKEIQFIRTYVRSKPSSQSIALTVNLDQGEQISRTATLSAGGALNYNNAHTYNSGLGYPGGTNEKLDFWVNRQCRNFQPQWSGTDPSDIAGYDVIYRIVE